MSNSPLTNAIIVTLLLFFTTITVGWVGSAQNPAVGEELMKLFEKEVAGQMDGENPFDMCIKLFFNNLQACILLFLGGATFGILTIFIMSLNGIVIGAIMEIVTRTTPPSLLLLPSSRTASSRSRPSSSPGLSGSSLPSH